MAKNTAPLKSLNIFSGKGIQMRTFHITWVTFFFCFFGWFGIIASVSATIIARLIIGKLCDSIGPRLSYTVLLILGSFPVMLIGFSNSYETFLLFRFVIGIIGASFVITQFHTSMMFAPSIIGIANAVSGGWGNLGGGVTNLVMPLIASGFVALGYCSTADSWRYAMVVPGVILLIMAFVYYRFTKDTPQGNFKEINREAKKVQKGSFLLALKDYRTWILGFAYAACFGIEITIDNVAAVYFVDKFETSMIMAGALASIFGMMNLFARALGGIVSDKVGKTHGLKGKGYLLGLLLVIEGIGIALFAQAQTLTTAIIAMLVFALFLKMANGGTYSIVPFINKNAIGSVSGIVGAGGNLGAMMVGFLFKSEDLTYTDAFEYIGIGVVAVGILVFLTRFQTGKTIEAEVVVQAEPALQTA